MNLLVGQDDCSVDCAPMIAQLNCGFGNSLHEYSAFDEGDEVVSLVDLEGKDCAGSLLQLASGSQKLLPSVPKFAVTPKVVRPVLKSAVTSTRPCKRPLHPLVPSEDGSFVVYWPASLPRNIFSAVEAPSGTSSSSSSSSSASSSSAAIWGKKSSSTMKMPAAMPVRSFSAVEAPSGASSSSSSVPLKPTLAVKVRKAGKPFKSSPLKCTRVDGHIFVSNVWVENLIADMPKFTALDLKNFREFIEIEYKDMFDIFTKPGSSASGLTYNAVQKLICIDWLLSQLAKLPCQDSRILGEAGNIISLSPVSGESEPGRSTRALLCGRSIHVKDTVSSNFAFREMQRAGKSWPSGGLPHAKGTKGITDAFDLVGLGPNSDAVAWKVRTGHHRGPEDTDPDNPFTLKEGEEGKVRETDGLYFKEMVFSLDRLGKAVLDTRQRTYKSGYSIEEIKAYKEGHSVADLPPSKKQRLANKTSP
jgi:hypothetical protein